MHKPLLLGINQPMTGVPALYPSPPGCAGWRLWKMANMICGIGVREWMDRTDRGNLLADPVLPRDYRGAARRRAQLIAPLLMDRTVVILGRDVARAMDHDREPFVWAEDRDWVMIPHPSGRNLFYNNPIHEAAAGILLTELIVAPTG